MSYIPPSSDSTSHSDSSSSSSSSSIHRSFPAPSYQFQLESSCSDSNSSNEPSSIYDLSIPSLIPDQSTSSSSSSSTAYYHAANIGGGPSSLDQTIYRSVAAESYNLQDSTPYGFGSYGSTVDADSFPSQESSSLSQFDSFSSASSHKQLGFPSLNPKYGDSSVSQLPSVVVITPNTTTEGEVGEEEETAGFAPPPSPPGDYLEPKTHFFTNTPPLSVLKNLVSTFETLNVDCSYKMEQYKIKCVAYARDGSSRCEFVVRVWRASDKVRQGGCQYAVEFQRRFGEGMCFYQIYNKVKKQIQGGQSEIHLCCPSANTRAVFECPPLSLDDLAPTDESVYRESICCLRSMIHCDCVDVRSQGLAGLCELSGRHDPMVNKLMIEQGCVPLLVSMLSCDYQDVHRLALTTLANLTHQDADASICSLLFADDQTKNGLLNHCQNSECTQVVRECARMIANVFQTLGGERCYEDQEWKKCVEMLAASTDGQAQKHVATMMEALQS